MTELREMIDLSRIGFPEIPLLGRYQQPQSQEGLKPHSHPGLWEICFLVEGRQIYRVANQDYALGPMDLFITRPDEIHDTHQHPQERGALHWINVAPPVGRRRFLNLSAADGRLLIRKLAELNPRHFRGSDLLRALFERLWDSIETEPELLSIHASAIIVEILIEIIRCGQSVHSETRDPEINRVLTYIEGHMGQMLSPQDLANVAGLSESWFKAKFRRVVGFTPADYVMRRKIDLAKELLTTTNRPVTDIAFNLGFASSQYFATAFRRYVNCSPSEFRANNRN